MDGSVTLPHAVPAGGVVTVEFTEAINTATWGSVSCYVKDYLSETVSGTDYTATCSVQGQTDLQITKLPNLANLSTINFRVYSHFAGVGITTASIAKVTSKSASAGNTIDQSKAALASFSYEVNTAAKIM
jgi:hypothetical protein